MLSTIRHLIGLLRATLSDRERLALENVALRQQLVVLKRSVKRPKVTDADRVFWILLKLGFAEWRAPPVSG